VHEGEAGVHDGEAGVHEVPAEETGFAASSAAGHDPGARALDPERFAGAPSFADYLAGVEKNRELWHAVYERARVPDELTARARALLVRPRLLALSEDWCGDAVNTLPVIARFAEAAGWELRVLGRDANPDLMEAHLTNGRSRSIPVVIAYDEAFREMGWWGPRPGPLQAWIQDEGLSLSSPERYKVVRRWYATDRGRTTLEELMGMLNDRRR
jgi:hypothetical protein